MKRIVVTVTATAVAVVASIALSVGVASAWHATVVGQPTCMTDGSGGWNVVWTITNGETVPGHVMTFDSVDVNGDVNAIKPPVSASSVAPSGSVTGTSDQASSDDSATITVHAVWTFTTPATRASVSATVKKPADCVPSPTAATTTTTVDLTTTTAVPDVTTIAAPSIQGNVAVRVSDEAPQVEAVQVSAAAAAAAASAQQLPTTGGVNAGLVGGGVGLLLIGVALVVASRRRSAPL